ncbi:aspartyl-phosphate phosphatase Spo0E family protein [Aquibacillus rhizosphaerae]|uniref:Aspartyl-phosphate phosphatase Spo0E family protein n=1 Tax=Aquibacillus rhizosphaerae TaxID=3051431 RepID=A0ABT7LAI2_9BACI|nr:aspartyl-phosphate phosphatase Spo0E family protein [Aquibacillus sp. LR5S19]MDL4842210.1 aspartyl-phosphate phosphatase Spo0E family protein [Aquibacillus sp. LR5S19]
MTSTSALEIKIEKLRIELYQLSQRKIEQEQLLKVSQQLDEALNEFERIKKNK